MDDVLADLMIDMLAGTIIAVVTGIDVDVFSSVDENMLAATMVSSEKTLLFGWETFICWRTAASDCRSLQAQIPSYHV